MSAYPQTSEAGTSSAGTNGSNPRAGRRTDGKQPSFFSKKEAGLPIWAWVLIIGGGVVGYVIWVKVKGSSSTAAAATTPTTATTTGTTGQGQGGGFGWGGGGAGSSPSTTGTTTTPSPDIPTSAMPSSPPAGQTASTGAWDWEPDANGDGGYSWQWVPNGTTVSQTEPMQTVPAAVAAAVPGSAPAPFLSAPIVTTPAAGGTILSQAPVVAGQPTPGYSSYSGNVASGGTYNPGTEYNQIPGEVPINPYTLQPIT